MKSLVIERSVQDINDPVIVSLVDMNSQELQDYNNFNSNQTLPNPIIQQIIDLEKTITQRRIREAVLGIDNGWMAAIEAQIETLRGQL